MFRRHRRPTLPSRVAERTHFHSTKRSIGPRQFLPAPGGSCDECPFAATYQGSSSASTSVEDVLELDNTTTEAAGIADERALAHLDAGPVALGLADAGPDFVERRSSTAHIEDYSTSTARPTSAVSSGGCGSTNRRGTSSAVPRDDNTDQQAISTI